jgi:hypothetical protein
MCDRQPSRSILIGLVCFWCVGVALAPSPLTAGEGASVSTGDLVSMWSGPVRIEGESGHHG